MSTRQQIEVTEIEADEAQELLAAGQAILLDVREVQEYEEERIPGATLLPLSSFDPEELDAPKDRTLIVYCHAGVRSLNASAHLLLSGYTSVVSLRGGIESWKDYGFSTES